MSKLRNILFFSCLITLADYLFYKLNLLSSNKQLYEILFFILITILFFLLFLSLIYKTLNKPGYSKFKIGFYISVCMLLSVFIAKRMLVINKIYYAAKTVQVKFGSGLWKPDPHLAHKGIPNATGNYEYYPGDSISGTIKTSFDSLGYRSVEAPNLLPYDTLNLFLGCSYTFGDLILAEEGFPYKTSLLLKNNFINAGASAYGMGQMKQLIDSLLPKYKFKYVFVQLTPWLAERAMSLTGPAQIGYTPFPYFSDKDGGFQLNYPAYKTSKNNYKNWRTTKMSYFEKIQFMFTDGFKIEVLDYISDRFAKLKIYCGFMPAPTKKTAELEKYFYTYAIETIKKAGAIPIILKLNYRSENSSEMVNYLNTKCKLINLDIALDSVVSKTGQSYEQLYHIFHENKGVKIYYDEHPNAYANEVITQTIFSSLKDW